MSPRAVSTPEGVCARNQTTPVLQGLLLLSRGPFRPNDLRQYYTRRFETPYFLAKLAMVDWRSPQGLLMGAVLSLERFPMILARTAGDALFGSLAFANLSDSL